MMSTQAGQESGAQDPDDEGHETSPLLLVDGTIHSISEPYAEAMLVEKGVVSWLGAPDTAGRLTAQHHEHQELDRALVAPAFVGRTDRALSTLDAADVGAVLDAAAAHGQAALRLVLTVSAGELREDRHALRGHLIEILKTAYWHPLVVLPVLRLEGISEGAEVQRSALGELLALLDGADDAAGAPVGVELSLGEVAGGVLPAEAALTEELRGRTLEHLTDLSGAVASAHRQLLLDVAGHAAGAVAELIGGTRTRLRERRTTPRPDRPTILVDFDSDHREDWEALVGTAVHVLLRRPGHLGLALSVGVPTSVAPAEDLDPWGLIAEHVHRPQNAVSVRAAFNAQTRSAHRSFPEPDGAAPGLVGLAAQLDPGSAATYAVWEVESLAVQTPDARTAAWSTDARARTPLLPYLGTPDEPAARPRLRATVVSGVEVHGTADARHSAAGDP